MIALITLFQAIQTIGPHYFSNFRKMGGNPRATATIIRDKCAIDVA